MLKNSKPPVVYSVRILTNTLQGGWGFSVRESYFRVALLLAALGLGFVLSLVFDYSNLLFLARENSVLKKENTQIKAQMQGIKEQLQSFEKALDRTESLKAKLQHSVGVRMQVAGTEMRGPFLHGEANTSPRVPGALESLQQQELLVRGLYAYSDSRSGISVSANPVNAAGLVLRLAKGLRKAEALEQSMRNLSSLVEEHESLLGSRPIVQPVRGWWSSGFGMRVHPIYRVRSMHYGLDIAAMPGTPVHAPADGVVSYVGYDEGYGKLLAIDHGYGIKTRYGHNAQIFVRLGQRVKRYDVIASVGSTGRSTSSHLHYEVRENGVPVDPARYFLDDEWATGS